MNFSTILILIIAAALIIYFMVDHIKYSNASVYNQKRKRANELEMLISDAETENEEIEKLILSTNFERKLKNNVINKFIIYSDNLEKLKDFRKEQIEIERYLRLARSHVNFITNFGRY